MPNSLKDFATGCKIPTVYLIFVQRPIRICFLCERHISFYLWLFGIKKQLCFQPKRFRNSWTTLLLLASKQLILFWAQFLIILPTYSLQWMSNTSNILFWNIFLQNISSLRWQFYQMFHQYRIFINILPGSDNSFLPVSLLFLKLIQNILVFTWKH